MVEALRRKVNYYDGTNNTPSVTDRLLSSTMPALSALDFSKDNFDLMQGEQKREMRESLKRLEIAVQQNQNMQTVRNYYNQSSNTANNFIETKELITDTVAEGAAIGVGVVVGGACCVIPGVSIVGGAVITAGSSFASRYGAKKAMLGNSLYGYDDVAIDAGVSAVEGAVDITGASIAMRSVRYTAMARRGFAQMASNSVGEVGGRAFMNNSIRAGLNSADAVSYTHLTLPTKA